MKHFQAAYRVSERRACRVMDQPRGTQRYDAKPARDEADLVRDLHALARRHPRYGYRRLTAMLRRQGWRVNRKRVARGQAPRGPARPHQGA